jgi:hypothetical protein
MSDELRRRLGAASSALISTFLEFRKRNISRLNPIYLKRLEQSEAVQRLERLEPSAAMETLR